jgi:3-hydroxyisobutyrate dehydrogenase-like beta-hydroxyacid dehydrogenase
MKIGFIGLGRMGQGMARRLLGAGHALCVYNRTAEKAAPLGEAGATVAPSVAAACEGREAVITMLTDDAALEELARREGGLLEALPAGAVHVAMGTHGVHTIGGLAGAHGERGQVFVAAPVLGRPDRAAAGELGIVAAGPAEAVRRLRPMFEVLGATIFEAGSEPVAAAAIKIANNFILGCAIEAMGEGVSFVRKFGVEPAVLQRVLTEGLFAAPAYKVYGDIIVDQAYDQVGVTALIGLKDANLAQAAAELVGVPLPSVSAWRDRLVGAVAHGDGERDWAVVAREQARASGLDD